MINAFRRWLFLVLLLALYGRLAAADYTFLTVASPSSDRRTTAGELGARFSNTSGQTVTITHVGRWIFSGNSGTQTIRVWGYFGEFIESVTVNLSGTPGTWAWAELATPLEVAVGYKVYILSLETGANEWSNAFGGSGYSAARGDIGEIEAASNTGTLESPNLQPQGGQGWSSTYGPINFRYSTPVRTWTKEGNVYTTDGSTYQVSSAIYDATPGDIITIPAGTYTWGTNGTKLNINKAVTLQGAGMDATFINQSVTAQAGWTGSASLINVGANATIRRMTITGANLVNANVFYTTGSGWRISELKYVQYPGLNPYFLAADGAATGLIDNCDISGGMGNAELIFIRGPAGVWDAASPVGTANNVFVEDCIFRGNGYVNDGNNNAAMVVRNCLITGPIKIDGHGFHSNGASGQPSRGVRNTEAYRNLWTYTDGTWTAMEIRGGTGMVWGNRSTSDSAANNAWFYLTEYGVASDSKANFPEFQTPYDYPIRDQIGRGQYATPGDWTTATSEPMYVWDNLKGGAQWPLSYKGIWSGAYERYRIQTGNPAATFTWEDIIQPDRDYFMEVASFSGSTGVGMGAFAAKPASPTKTGVGYWATDQGEWDSTNGATPDGQLYRWNGSAWVLHYTPYPYPHPSRGALAAPSFLTNPSSQAVAEGATVTLYSAATSNPGSSYQWRKGGVNISGETNSSLVITNFESDDVATYTVVATNSEGNATSSGASLTLAGVTPTVATPTFTPSGTTHSTPQEITITSATSGVTFYFTTDGSTPTTSSTLYNPASKPVMPFGTTTLKAIGVKAEYNNSAVQSVTYVITVSPGDATIGVLNAINLILQ